MRSIYSIMKQMPILFFKSFYRILFLSVVTFVLSDSGNAQVASPAFRAKTIQFTEEEIKPTLDGFVAQSSGNFNAISTSAELKRGSGFNREIYLTYDLSTLTIAAKSAKLKIFCQSFDKFGDLTVSVYCLPEYQTTGLTWTTRPAVPAAIATLLINQTEHANTWLECDISSSLAAVLATASKKVTYVIKITAGNDALLRFAMSENTTLSPTILLSDEDPTNGGVNSTIKMPTLFSDNMVLQRDKPIKVYGEVLPNLPVVITFDGQTYNAQCDANGKFSTLLPIKSASASSYILTVAANNEILTYKNIVMGDVYLCGGQSNMAMYVSGSNADQVANAKADANYPNLRFFEVAKIVSGGVLINAKDNPWKSALPDRIVNWSAVAFFVGRDLHKHLNVPIGLINVSHGGAPSDAFISPEAYANDPVLDAAKRPNATGIFSYYQSPSSLYTAMISKVAGYPIKGVLWYQAEANASFWQSYKTIFKGLIKDWRTQFNEPTLPWLFVQLPSFDPGGDATKLTWAETRDIQLQVWKEDPNTGMAVTIDLGEATNIHPTDKYTVAKRMLVQVRALVYGEQITHKSPIYQSHEVQGADMILSFDNLGSGLTAIKPITEFEIAGSDKIYKPATATLLADNRIKLTNATVPNPAFARYAFLNFPTVSVFTTDTLPLPLSPFKTESGGTLSISDFNQNGSTLMVYPNPTKGILNIKKRDEPKKIEIFDLNGAVVFQGDFTNKIDLSFLAKGFYFLRTNLNQTVKIVIE
ncbi:sialate O-acetylesterase [Flavobacterium nackdongense]|uniref:T9SS type A sorting domain-containing protein n=1 Tax=Flavobacterium nackdongense TaxID=2547394 RepID=A0A4P6YHG8_9FLAO|nr:sialate O-acetylesterase [Flavobacterium nackdongense]QBN20384.1 T9SS type A sorting domain-containing protein [Flavobacterium nackdongense]